MAKTVPLDAPALAWARSEFATYYAAASVPVPERLARRELAAFPFAEASLMRRHTTVPDGATLVRYLRETVPRHVYYSSAYYRRPGEPTMAAKEWLGADLIFDLDADHLRGAEGLDYPGQLALVKRRLLYLVDDFLERDFGIPAASAALVFSGGRGYHVHVADERFLPLTSPERRELVDYVLGTGVEPASAVEQVRADVRAGRTAGAAEEEESPSPRGKVAQARQLADPASPGWRGRTTRGVLLLLGRWQAEGLKAAEEEMVAWGMGRPKARRRARLLLEEGGAERIRTTRALAVFRKDSESELEEFLDAALRQVAVGLQGETDAPVTTDIHRLIRLPGSLHGGTGFRVVPLDRDGIAAFDPFRDALAEAPDGRTAAVTFLQEVRYPFPGGLHRAAGATDELPTPLALFLVLRGEAVLRPSPG